jgi:glycosyltransferase involved in cell wall biosynthesis
MIVRLFFPWIGGTERQAHKLAKILIANGLDVKIVTGWWFRKTPQRENIEGVPVFRNITLWEMFGIRGLRRFGGYLYILSLLWYLGRTRNEYDIIHVHGLNYHTFTAALAGRWFHKKVIAKLANSGDASDIKKMRREQQLPLASYMIPTALKCDRFVATTGTIVNELKAEGVPAGCIVQLPNGVETDLIDPKSGYNFGKTVRVTFVGRLHDQKGLDILFQGFSKLCEKFSSLDIQLQLVGDGPLRNNLLSLAKQLKIDAKVNFVGKTDRVYSYLKETDIFVLPSRAEGMSNALLEAMAFGLPVIVSNIPGNALLVQNEKNGLVFETENSDALVEALSLCLNDSAFRERMGKAARSTIEEKYSLESVAERYIALYREFL